MAVIAVAYNDIDDAERMRRAVKLTGDETQFFKCATITDPGAGDITFRIPVWSTLSEEYFISLRKVSDDTQVVAVGLSNDATEWEWKTGTLSHAGGYDVYLAIHASNSGTPRSIWVSRPIGVWYAAAGAGKAWPFVPLDSDGALAAFAPVVVPDGGLDADALAWGEVEVSAVAAQATSAAVRALLDMTAADENIDRRTVEILASAGVALEDIAPDAIVASNGSVTGAVTDVDESPDSPDGNALALVGSFTGADVLLSFPTPSVAPVAGAGKQKFRLWIRGNSATTAWTCKLAESAGVVTDFTPATIGTSYEMVELTWDAGDLATASGANVEIFIAVASGVNVDIDAVEWVADSDTGPDLRFIHYDGDAPVASVNSDAESDGSDWIDPFTIRARWSLCGLWEDRASYAGVHFSGDDFATSTGDYGRDAAWTMTIGNDAYDTIYIGHRVDDPIAVGAGTRESYFTGGIGRVRLKAREQSLYPPPAAVVPLDADEQTEVTE